MAKSIEQLYQDETNLTNHYQSRALKAEAENAELRADRERRTKLLSDCLGILEIALRAHPGGAFLNAVCEEELPRFRAAIDAARERSPVANPTQTPKL